MPLDIFCEQEALKAYCRLAKILEFGWKGTMKWKHHGVSHMKHWENQLTEVSGWDHSSDKIKLKIWCKNFTVDLKSYKETGGKITHSQCNIYTDGSKMSEGVGAGFIIIGKTILFKEKYKLPYFCSVFQAEMLAIRKATEKLLEQDNMDYVKVFSDSQAALLALDSPSITSKLTAETKLLLNTLGRRCKRLSLVWTRAHVGTFGNEEADREGRYTMLSLIHI